MPAGMENVICICDKFASEKLARRQRRQRKTKAEQLCPGKLVVYDGAKRHVTDSSQTCHNSSCLLITAAPSAETHMQTYPHCIVVQKLAKEPSDNTLRGLTGFGKRPLTNSGYECKTGIIRWLEFQKTVSALQDVMPCYALVRFRLEYCVQF